MEDKPEDTKKVWMSNKRRRVSIDSVNDTAIRLVSDLKVEAEASRTVALFS